MLKENPLPPDIDEGNVITIRDFLWLKAKHPVGELDYATQRYGRRVCDAYTRLRKHRPYTKRFKPGGPVKVYILPDDQQLLFDVYAEWHRSELLKRYQSITE
jgi:hypothetical protein